MTRRVCTPLGSFSSVVEAARAHNMKPNNMSVKIQNNPATFYYEDEATIHITEIKVKGVTYSVSELVCKVSKRANYKKVDGKWKRNGSSDKDADKDERVKNEKHYLRIAMMSLDELHEEFPTIQRCSLVSKRIYAKKQVKDNPIYIEWLANQKSKR